MADRTGVLGVDVGGTSIKAAVFGTSFDAAVFGTSLTALSSWRVATPLTGGYLPVPELAMILVDLLESAKRANLDIARIGLVVPGVVDEAVGVVEFAANLGWQRLGLLAGLRDAGLPNIAITLGQDVRAGGLAEFTSGAAEGVDNAVFVAIGTGLAAAIKVDGSVLTAGGYAGELGHLRVAAAGSRPCPCGGIGCAETIASASAIAARYREAGGVTPAGAESVSRQVESGDVSAKAVWDTAISGLAEALAAAVAVAAPQTIVIGGGLARAGETLLAPLRSALASRLTMHRRPAIVAAKYSDDAGMTGAALLALADR